MADFQAIIGNIVVSPTLITIDDTSDYAGSIQAGHLSADFSDFRKVVMVNTKRTYVYTTEGDGDSAINAGNGGTVTVNFSLLDDDIDGVYDFTLYTVPTFDIAINYDRFQCVYIGGLLYKSSINGNVGNTPATSSDWDLIDESLLSSVYCVNDSVIITNRGLLSCYEHLLADLVCSIETNPCKNLCGNEAFSKASKIMMLIGAICLAADNNDFVSARKKFNLVNQLCNIS